MTEPVEQTGDLGADLAAEAAALNPLDVEGTLAGAGALSDQSQMADQLAELQSLVAERTNDLQRVQAEYVNYKKRVDRDRALARQGGLEAVLRDLMPVFDSILAAQDHDDLTGGFKLTADELVRVTKSYGFESFGAVGDEFDPHLHEALMQVPSPDADVMTVHEVMQVGYRIGELVIRPARVIVAVPADQ